MPSPQCPICYELFIGWSEIAACPCGHTFHYHCVLRWSEDCKRARKKPECPTCKTKFDCDKAPNCLVPKLYFNFDSDDAEKEWSSGTKESRLDGDSDTIQRLRDELSAKNATTYTLQNRVTCLERETKEWVVKLTDEQNKSKKLESDVKDEKTKRETVRRQMLAIKTQAGDVQKVHAQNEALKKRLEECKTMEKVLKESTNGVEAVLAENGRSPDELAKYLIILKREMERHIGDKRKFKDEAKIAAETNFKNENELDRLRRDNTLKQERIEELRKDNAALLKRIRLSQSPMPVKRPHSAIAGENRPPQPKYEDIFTSPDGVADGRSNPKKKRLHTADLNSSIDLFGSPVLSHPGSIETPPMSRVRSASSCSSSVPSSSSPPSSSADGCSEGRSIEAEAESPNLALANRIGVKYVKMKTDFEAISKNAMDAVVTPESVVPVRRPTGLGGGLLGRAGGGGGSVRTGFNATGGTSKFLQVKAPSMPAGSGSSCGSGVPRVASFGAKSTSSGISKYHKSVADQQKRNKQPSLNNFFGT